MNEPSRDDKLDCSRLKIGEPCYRCGKVISAPLSHMCDTRPAASLMNRALSLAVLCVDGGTQAWAPSERELTMARALIYLSAQSAVARIEPTDEMADGARGVIQLLRGLPGAMFESVRLHCERRGDDMSRWPQWAREAEGYVTETAAACLVYELMQAHAPVAQSAIGESYDELRNEIVEECADLADQKLDRFSGTECTYICDVADAIRALKNATDSGADRGG